MKHTIRCGQTLVVLLGLMLAAGGLAYILLGFYGHFYVEMSGIRSHHMTYAVLGMGFGMLALSVFSCFSAVTRSKCMMYFLSCSLPFIVIGVVGLGLSAYFLMGSTRNEMSHCVRKIFNEYREEPLKDENAKRVVDLQHWGQCCGLEDADFFSGEWYQDVSSQITLAIPSDTLLVPYSCCHYQKQNLTLLDLDRGREILIDQCPNSVKVSQPFDQHFAHKMLWNTTECDSTTKQCTPTINKNGCLQVYLAFSQWFCRLVWMISAGVAIVTFLSLSFTCCVLLANNKAEKVYA